VCLLASPDAQLELDAGGATLVPGECAVAPRARGGRLEVQVRDGRRGRTTRRWIAVRRTRVTMISALDGAIVVQERRACADAGAGPPG